MDRTMFPFHPRLRGNHHNTNYKKCVSFTQRNFAPPERADSPRTLTGRAYAACRCFFSGSMKGVRTTLAAHSTSLLFTIRRVPSVATEGVR